MAANFWRSSHKEQWILEREKLNKLRKFNLINFSEEEYKKIFIFFSNFIQVLGEQLKVPQQVIATASVYFKRFYIHNSFKSIDPLLLAPTCIFLASKVEEYGVITITSLVNRCITVVKNKFSYAYKNEFPYRCENILECEFYLLEKLDCCLIVFQPYRPLVHILQGARQEELLSLSWRVINDSLRTDICLLYPPYIIALGCLQVACVILQKDFRTLFGHHYADLEQVQDIVCILTELFDFWLKYNEENEIHSILAKMPKPKSRVSFMS